MLLLIHGLVEVIAVTEALHWVRLCRLVGRHARGRLLLAEGVRVELRGEWLAHRLGLLLHRRAESIVSSLLCKWLHKRICTAATGGEHIWFLLRGRVDGGLRKGIGRWSRGLDERIVCNYRVPAHERVRLGLGWRRLALWLLSGLVGGELRLQVGRKHIGWLRLRIRSCLLLRFLRVLCFLGRRILVLRSLRAVLPRDFEDRLLSGRLLLPKACDRHLRVMARFLFARLLSLGR